MRYFFLLLSFTLLNLSYTYSQWNIQYTPGTSQTVMCMKFYDNNTGYHSGVLYNGSFLNIHKTTNGGINYIQQNSNYTAQRFMSVFILHPDTVLMCGNYGKIIKTVNGGNNWSSYVHPDTTVQFWGLYFVNSMTGFIAGSAGTIMKTTNKGVNWTVQNTPTGTALDGIYFVNENTGYVGGANVFLKTTNAGANWVNKTGSFISPFETATAVYFSDSENGIYCTNAGRIVTTTNGGDTWTLVYSMSGGIWGLSFPNSLTGYACTSTGKVLKTTNGGTVWGEQNTPLSENLYEIHFPSVQTGYIASWSGKILKTTNGGLTFLSNNGNEIPQGFSLEQNFPNPFNPSTKISFRLPAAGFSTLKIFDITGKEVATLVNELLQPGIYSFDWNASQFPGGVYFYRLTSETYSETKSMILLK